MDIVSEVADKIYLIAHYREDSLYGFHAFFIADEKPTLIEPGPSTFVPKILDGLQKLGYEASSLAYIIPTHIHADHCGGTGDLARHAPKARIIAHGKGAKHLIDPTIMVKATKAAWGEDYESTIGSVMPVPGERIDVIYGGETIPLGRRSLSIIPAPGHARHHICLYEASGGELFCGESLGLLLPGDEVTVLPIAAPPVFELDAELDTIDRLRKLRPSTIFYSHSGISHHADRCIELVEENTKAWGDIVLQALQNGESLEQIKARLRAIVAGLQVGRVELFSLFLDWATLGYTGYFYQRGMVSRETKGYG